MEGCCCPPIMPTERELKDWVNIRKEVRLIWFNALLVTKIHRPAPRCYGDRVKLGREKSEESEMYPQGFKGTNKRT